MVARTHVHAECFSGGCAQQGDVAETAQIGDGLCLLAAAAAAAAVAAVAANVVIKVRFVNRVRVRVRVRDGATEEQPVGEQRVKDRFRVRVR